MKKKSIFPVSCKKPEALATLGFHFLVTEIAWSHIKASPVGRTGKH